MHSQIDGGRYMPEDSVRDLLIKMGAPLAALNYHKVVADMKGNTDKQKELEGSSISLREFTRWTESHQSRNVVGTCAFFLQTMSLICSGLMDITFLEVCNHPTLCTLDLVSPSRVHPECSNGAHLGCRSSISTLAELPKHAVCRAVDSFAACRAWQWCQLVL